MAPRRKSRERLTSNREDGEEQPADPRNGRDIEEWVYRFLGNLAAIECSKKDENTGGANAPTTDRRPLVRKTKRRRFRSPTPYSWDRVTPSRSPVADDHQLENSDVSVTNEGGDDEGASPPLPRNENQHPETAAPLEDKTEAENNQELLNKINRYIKSGIAEGKRRAKRYVQKALTFAVDMGYLVKVDRSGKLLRISPGLIESSSTKWRVPKSSRRSSKGKVNKARSPHEHTRSKSKRSKKPSKAKKPPPPGEQEPPHSNPVTEVCSRRSSRCLVRDKRRLTKKCRYNCPGERKCAENYNLCDGYYDERNDPDYTITAPEDTNEEQKPASRPCSRDASSRKSRDQKKY